MDYEDHPDIQLLREYLRIQTAYPNIDYEQCLLFLNRQAIELDLHISYIHPSRPNKPVVIITWPGSNTELPGIMLNSHMDVASVFPESWVYAPFSAHIDEYGMIYGRGIQDSKGLGMEYLAAIRALKREGFQGRRTVYLTFMPDEGIGGYAGMRTFVATNYFRRMNVGFALDVGVATCADKCPVFYAERTKCLPVFKISGASGEASFMPKGSAGEKLEYLLNKLTNLREKESSRLQENSDLTLGDVTSVNLTMVDSNEENNVLPSMIEARFDIRLSLKVDPEQFIRQLYQWCDEAGGGIELIIVDSDFIREATSMDNTNPYWTIFKRVCDEEEIMSEPLVLPGATDNRFLRHMGIPALNFSPMPHTPNLAYDHNECLHAEVFLQGVEFYKKLIPALLNAGPSYDHSSTKTSVAFD